MSKAVHLQSEVNYEQLLEGLSESANNYMAALEEVDPACLLREGGPTDDERTLLSQINKDIIVPKVLGLTEDMGIILSSEEFKKSEFDGYCEMQYALDDAIGRVVSRDLALAVNTQEALDVLPDKAVAIFEINTNRGFPRGSEDNAGCHGAPQDWLGHIVIDAYYSGEEMIGNSYKQHDKRIDYMGEPGGWTTYGDGLERNAARIRIRPSYPKIQDSYSSLPVAARETFEIRSGTLEEPENAYIHPDYLLLRGEYRICRAVSFLHDLTDWTAKDFQDREDAFQSHFDKLVSRTFNHS